MGVNDILDELEAMKSVEEYETEISMLGREFNSIPETKKKPVAELLARSHSGFKRIPPDHLTADMINMEKHRICEKVDAPGEITSWPYPELVEYLLIEGRMSFSAVHPVFITKELVLKVFRAGNDAGFHIGVTQGAGLIIDEELANVMVKLDVRFILHVPNPAVVDDHCLLEGLMNKPDNAHYLARFGREHVVRKAVAEGLWPGYKQKPKSLVEAINMRMKNQKNDDLNAYLNAFISNFQPDEVVPLMRSEARKKVLLGIYPPDVLLNLMPNDNFVKTSLLDQAMAL